MLIENKIGIINYGLGNLASVYNACLYCNLNAKVIDTPEHINTCSHLILPGVGTFSAAMKLLESGQWVNPIISFAEASKPLLGICLGMQLLLDSGNEISPTKGLGLIPGSVNLMPSNSGFKIPHIGWNSLKILQPHPILKGINDLVDFYFVHSYACLPNSPEHLITTTEHSCIFPSIISKNSIVGVQFHPEKSQPSGLRLLKNFSKLV